MIRRIVRRASIYIACLIILSACATLSDTSSIEGASSRIDSFGLHESNLIRPAGSENTDKLQRQSDYLLEILDNRVHPPGEPPSFGYGCNSKHSFCAN